MKNRLFARSLIVMVFAVIALALAGCDQDDMTGGGWIELDSGKKANFAFNFKCKSDDNGNAKVSGQLQYNDHEEGVSFHGVADSLIEGGTCNGLLDTWEGQYFGTYTPQPRKLGEGGRFEIKVVDSGEKGPSKGDELTLTLDGGCYAGYKIDTTFAEDGTLKSGNIKGGNIKGGNIKAHGAKSSE